MLPLSMLPLETRALEEAALIKNIALDTVIEFFRGKQTGSGQIAPEQLCSYLDWQRTIYHLDLEMLNQLAQLNSFDVYSLRIALRDLGITVNDHTQLCLSESKSRELARYMTAFAAPIIQRVFGETKPDIHDYDQLIQQFRSPNKEQALANLKSLAKHLNIDFQEVPHFLEDYGDTFLSLAYFRQCMDEVVPKVEEFLDALAHLRSNYDHQQRPGFIAACDYIEPRLKWIISSTIGRFDSFDQNTKIMWNKLSAESFRELREWITAHHTTLGGVLCGLTVKMDAWEGEFGKKSLSSAMLRKVDFIMGDMRRGIEKIVEIESSAPRAKIGP